MENGGCVYYQIVDRKRIGNAKLLLRLRYAPSVSAQNTRCILNIVIIIFFVVLWFLGEATWSFHVCCKSACA